MKQIPTVVAALFLAAVLGMYMCTFQVRSTEVAIVKQMGRVLGTFDEPGLKWKWFWPIQSVVKYDRRDQILEDKTEETATRDGKNVILTTYTIWRIADPARFHANFTTMESGEGKLRSLIQTCKNEEVGQRTFAEFVSTDPNERRLDQIEDAILQRVRIGAEKEYGVKVVDFGLKQLGLPQSVTVSIFESMKAAQKRKADRYLAEGEAQAQAILGEAGAAEKRLVAAAARKVAEIEALGLQKVSEFYVQFDEYPELRIFLDWVRTTAQALSKRSLIVLTSDEAPFKVFTDEGQEELLGIRNKPDADKSSAAAGSSSWAEDPRGNG